MRVHNHLIFIESNRSTHISAVNIQNIMPFCFAQIEKFFIGGLSPNEKAVRSSSLRIRTARKRNRIIVRQINNAALFTSREIPPLGNTEFFHVDSPLVNANYLHDQNRRLDQRHYIMLSTEIQAFLSSFRFLYSLLLFYVI